MEQTVADIFINKSIDEWRQRLEAVVKNNGEHMNVFSNNLTILVCINLPLDHLLYDIAAFRIFMFYKVM